LADFDVLLRKSLASATIVRFDVRGAGKGCGAGNLVAGINPPGTISLLCSALRFQPHQQLLDTIFFFERC